MGTELKPSTSTGALKAEEYTRWLAAAGRPDAEELELSFGLLPEAAQEHVVRLIDERDRALAEIERLREEIHRLRQRDDEMRPIVAGLRLEIDVRKRGEEELARQRDELRAEVERPELATATVRGEGMAIGEKRERTRLRKELKAALAAWTGGAHPNSLRMDVARDLYSTLDRIIPKED